MRDMREFVLTLLLAILSAISTITEQQWIKDLNVILGALIVFAFFIKKNNKKAT
jgi:hypothetical protein